MGLGDSNDVILAPENLGFAYFEGFSLFVEAGEMQDQEVVVVVDVDFGTLVRTSAVFYIQRVEMEVVFQKL